MQPKIKVSKLMPDVFLHSRNALPKDKEKKNLQKQALDKQKVNNQQKINIDKEAIDKKQQKKKKNRNPFFNVRQYLKLSNDMVERLKQVREELDKQKFSQFSFQNNLSVGHFKQQIQVKESKIKFEDCITLKDLKKKTQSSSFKKVLHVPTLTVYFLRQSLIDFSIDKNDLQQWIRKCNTQTDSSSIRPQKIVQLFWNTPQNNFSILYQYVDGVMLDTILQNTSIFPLRFIQNLALTHLKAQFQIFNSILIIKRNTQSQIRYLPVYQEVDDIIPQYRTFKEMMKINKYEQNQNVNKIEKTMVARLGFLVLIAFFSDAIIDEDITNILFESKDCCLFHKQMLNNQSLMKIYFQNNIIYGSEKQIISDFFCKMLKFKSEQRANFSQLSKHKFFRTKFMNQICKMQQIISMLELTGTSSSKNPSRDMCYHNLNKFLNKMSVILQGSSEKQKKQINIHLSNENLKYILTDIGFTLNQIQTKINMNDILKKFQKVYEI